MNRRNNEGISTWIIEHPEHFEPRPHEEDATRARRRARRLIEALDGFNEMTGEEMDVYDARGGHASSWGVSESLGISPIERRARRLLNGALRIQESVKRKKSQAVVHIPGLGAIYGVPPGASVEIKF